MRERLQADVKSSDGSDATLKSEKKEESPSSADAPVPVVYSKKTILAILNTPFYIGEAVTGYAKPIPKHLEPVLAETGEQILKDFGPELSMKWLNLAVFGVVYGGCAFTYWSGLKEAQARTIAEQKRRKGELKTDEKPEHMRDRDKGVG